VCEFCWCLAHEGVRITRENLVALCMQKFHFEAQPAFTGHLLACDIVSMDGFIPILPERQEMVPEKSQSAERPTCSGVCAGVNFLTSHVVVLFESPLGGQVSVE
jgi:hypothetical protein